MTDDVVVRLREVACDNRWCGNDPHCRLCDGIDEIERLRAELKEAARQFDILVSKYKARRNEQG